MPTPLHETFASSFIESRFIVGQNHPSGIANQICVVGNQRVQTFTGVYDGSKKGLDVLFKYIGQNYDVS